MDDRAFSQKFLKIMGIEIIGLKKTEPSSRSSVLWSLNCDKIYNSEAAVSLRKRTTIPVFVILIIIGSPRVVANSLIFLC